MTTTPKVLIAAQDVPNSATVLYTSPASGKGTWIDKATTTNYSGSTATLSINLVPSGGSAGNSNLLIKARSLAASATDQLPELAGKFLNPGDFISVQAGTATAVNIAVNGRELT